MLKTILDELINIASEKKAESICYYEVSESNALTDYVVIMQAGNKIHVKSLIEDLMKEAVKLCEKDPVNFYSDIKLTGNAESAWVILDLNSIIIHIMTEELRSFYKLDDVFLAQGPVFHV